MMRYTQLTREQRYQIQALMKAGKNQTEIAEIVGVHKSTISRELRRNTGLRSYRPEQAHQFCLQRRADKIRPSIPPETWRRVRRLLREDWSPEQISLWLAREAGFYVSHESIYQYILTDKQAGGTLYRHLRCQKSRRKRYGAPSRRGQIPAQVSIDQRPAIVDARRRFISEPSRSGRSTA